MDSLPHLLNQLSNLEEIVQYRDFPPSNQSNFQHQPGQSNILISAPHGAAHHRSGQFKPEEEFTTGLARLLAQKTGGHAFFMTYQDAHDPNWDMDHAYKSALKKTIQENHISFVIDLHGMTNRYGMGMAIGTINGRACPEQEEALINSIESAGFEQRKVPELEPLSSWQRSIQFKKWATFVVNHPKFTGGVKSHTITRFVTEELGVPGVQIELASVVRIVEREAHGSWPIYRGDPEGIRQTIVALERFIQRI